MEILFWLCAGFVLYVYSGFPLLLLLRSRFAGRPYREEPITPSVTVVIAARNEEAVIGARLDNLLSLDYPSDSLDAVIVSDGSNDATNDIVRKHANGHIRLLALERVGKPEALNAGVAAATGEVLVFSDANSMFRPDAVRRLVRPLADPTVGGVAGNQIYLPPGESDASVVGEEQYWNLDRRLKKAESDAGSVSGATGAIYAIRRRLFQPLRADVNNDDFLNSLGVVAQGSRLVFEPSAVAYEVVPETTEVTFHRRVRVMVGGFRCLIVMRSLLNPLRYGFFAVQLLTRKVLLRTMVFPLVLLAVLAPLLWSRGLVYQVATAGQCLFYLLGLAGIALRGRSFGRSKVLALPAYFCLVNAASAKAIWLLLRGNAQERWEPQRAGSSANGSLPGSSQL